MNKEYTIEDLKKTDWLIYESVVGSIAYGTNNKDSDIDVRGIFVYPDEFYTAIEAPQPQIGDDKHDIVYYSLKRIFELLGGANPNIIELLWMPEDCRKIVTPKMKLLLDNRKEFISKKCFETHSGYAYSQIKKAKGQNKKVHNPCPKEQPKKEDFCRIIPAFAFDIEYLREESLKVKTPLMPARPIPLNDCNFDLSLFHAAALEHVPDTYRLYMYGDDAKGVFRGNDMLVCESIPIEDEVTKFAGLLIYNKHEYEKAIKDHRSYWDWKNNRNEARWVDQEKGKLNYDQKNMMHCLRLLMSGENILKHGEPLVRFEGKQLDYLMSIRNGEMEYEQLMADVNRKMKELEELHSTSKIPDDIDIEKVNELYKLIRSY